MNDIRKQAHEADALVLQKAREAEDKMSSLAQNTLAQAEESAKQTRQDANKSIDNIDKTVERKASEAKNGIASWLGFK